MRGEGPENNQSKNYGEFVNTDWLENSEVMQ